MDDEGKFVKVKWVRVNKGCKMNPKIRCRLVAQEVAYGERIDELFAGTPSLSSVKIALHLAAEGGCDYKLMVMDVKCAFLYGKMKRNIYIELPTQDERYGDKNLVGKLVKAMYGTRDAPQIWEDLVQETMASLGMQSRGASGDYKSMLGVWMSMMSQPNSFAITKGILFSFLAFCLLKCLNSACFLAS